MRTKRNNGLSLMTDFDSMLDTFFNDTPFWNNKVPSVDIREEEEKYRLEAEMPGIDEKDINVKIENDLLTISTEKDEKNEEKKKGYVLKERRSSSFSRGFVLPKGIDREKIEATMKNGVLTLDIPKAPEAKPKNITIKVK